jgi:hypothetical protein
MMDVLSVITTTSLFFGIGLPIYGIDLTSSPDWAKG